MFFGDAYGQQTITISTPFETQNELSSWIIGTGRNHMHNQVTEGQGTYNETMFDEKQFLYRNEVTPVFGEKRKLYRLGGNNIDGGNEYVDLTYPEIVAGGYHWDKNYDGTFTDNNGNTIVWNGSYPYDNLIHFIEEALEMNADMVVGVNVVHNSAQSAADLVTYLTNLELLDPVTGTNIHAIDRVAYFELGNETPATWIVDGCDFAATPTTYCNNIAPIVRAMREAASDVGHSIRIALMDGYNNDFDWGFQCPNWNCETACGPLNIVSTYLNYIDPVTNEKLDFDFIAFHGYTEAWRFPHSGSGEEPSVEQCTISNGVNDDFNLLMSANQWFLESNIGLLPDDNLINHLLEEDGRGIRLVNTEFSTAYAFGNSLSNPHGIVQALFTADNMLTSIVADIPSAVAFSYLHIPGSGSLNYKDNVFFAPNAPNGSSQILTLPIFELQKMVASNLGKVRISSTQNFDSSPITFCNNTGYNYTKLGHVATLDNDPLSANFGTIYSLLLNRSLDEAATIAYNIDGQYQAELMVMSAESLSSGVDVGGFNPIDLPAITLPKLSICILKLTPIGDCHSYTITENTTWNTSSAPPGPYGEVKVENGATLTINGEARFCTEGKLNILEGSNVVLNGTLTADNTIWKGVRLNNAATFDGTNSLITKAEIGIQSVMGIFGYSTGTINCDQVQFVDNGIAVDLSRGYFPSTFKRCTFKSTVSFVNSIDKPRFVSIRWANGVNIRGCSFIDERAVPDVSEIGVYGFRSNFSINHYVEPGAGSTISTFTNIPIGVLGSTFGHVSLPFTVQNTTFNKCGVGIHSDRIQGADIESNLIRFDQNFAPAGEGWYDSRQFGVRIDGPTENFTLEYNAFLQSSGFLQNKTGTQVNNLGWADNAIRNNRYTNMDLANVAFFTNGHPTSDNGLLYECNTMTNNTYDFYTDNLGLNLITIKPHQGVNLGAPSYLWRSSANKFSPNNYSWDFVHSGSTAQPTITYHHLDNTIEKPDHFQGLTLDPLNVIDNNTCDERVKRPGKDLTPNEKEVNEQEYLKHYKQFVEAQKEYQDAQRAQNRLRSREKLAEVSWVKRKMWETVTVGFMAAIYDYQLDLKNRDEIRLWLGRYGTYEGDILLAEDFAGSQQWSSAQRVLDRLTQKYKLREEQYTEIRQIEEVYELLAKGDIDKLDIETQDYLDELARTNIGYGSALARSIMSLYGEYYQPLVSDVNIENSKGAQVTKEGDLVKMAISPNPADYNVLFDWSKFEIDGTKSVSIEISSKIGGLVQVLKPKSGQTSMEWTTEAVSSGIIYYRLLIDNKELDAGQILINK